jgi:hypothetical protein
MAKKTAKPTNVDATQVRFAPCSHLIFWVGRVPRAVANLTTQCAWSHRPAHHFDRTNFEVARMVLSVTTPKHSHPPFVLTIRGGVDTCKEAKK